MRTVLDTLKLTEIFICCDGFCKELNHYAISSGYEQPRQRQMSESEVMSILVFCHHSGSKCFKYYCQHGIRKALGGYRTKPYAYAAFVAQVPRVNLLLFAFLSAGWPPPRRPTTSTPPPWRSATTAASGKTRPSSTWPAQARTRWAGSWASSCMRPSTSRGSWRSSLSRPPTRPTTATCCRKGSRQGSKASSTATEAA